MKPILLLLAYTLIALGNDAALNPGGHGPTTLGEFQGDESVIRMVSEKIDIRFAKTESEVHCRFVFRSGKTTGDAIQLVGFPDILEHENYSGFIRKLETFVDGRKVESRKERGWFAATHWFAATQMGTPKCGLGKPPPELRPDDVQLADFHVITVSFPPDKDVVIERHYVADNGGDVFGSIWFDYSTHTGAVWRGTIGRADFHVKLDGLTVDDLAFEDGPQKNPPRSQWGWCAPNRAEWRIVSPTELTMTWNDFEPAVHQTRRGIKLATWSKGLPDANSAPGVSKGLSIGKETLSPDGRYGVLVPDLDHYDNEKHQNQLVEVSGGKVLAVIFGETGFEHMNHGGPAQHWTRDGTGLLWIVGGKWFPRAVNYLKIADGKFVWQTNLLKLSQTEMLRRTKAAAPQAYAAAVLKNKGHGQAFPDGFVIGMQLPQSDPALPLEFTVDLTSNPKQLENFPGDAEIRGTMRGVLKGDGSIHWSDFNIRTGADALR